MANLGFVGLGVMGGRMAKRLLQAGHTVTAYNRTSSRGEWLLEFGIRLVESPRMVAESVDVTFSMVADTRALTAVTEGHEGILAGLGRDKIYVDMSTVSSAAVRMLAERVAEKGAFMLDAPVSGSATTLESGQLSFMVGGDPDVLEKVRPLLQDIGSKVTYVGVNGMAASMKVATNLSLSVQMLAFSEGLLLAEKSGIPRETAMEVLLNSVIASPMLKYRAPLILEMPDEVWFDINMTQKDLLLALEMGRELDVCLPTASITNQVLTAARAMGLDKQDFAIMFQALNRMSGADQV